MKRQTFVPAVTLALLLNGCTSASESPSGGRPANCDSSEQLPTPVPGALMPAFEAIKDAIAADMMTGDPGINSVDADETRGTVVVGTTHPSAELCDFLHARYGPLIEVVYSEPAQLRPGFPGTSPGQP